jgi:hypothetical protein
MGLQQAFTTNNQPSTIPDLFSYIMYGDSFSIEDKRYQRMSPCGNRIALCERQDDGSFRPSNLSAETFLLAIHTKCLKTGKEYHVNGEMGKVLNGSCFAISDEKDAPLFKVFSSPDSLELRQVCFTENGIEPSPDTPVRITANELLEAIVGTNLRFPAPWTRCPTKDPQPSSPEGCRPRF